MARFDGTVALVSGGARGMGASHVRGLAGEGAKVVFGDILDEEGRSLQEEVGGSTHYVHLDVTNDDDWKAAVTVPLFSACTMPFPRCGRLVGEQSSISPQRPG